MSSISRRKFIPLIGTAIAGATTLSFQTTSPTEKPILLPNRLKKGDTIGIAASAGSIEDKKEVHDFQNVLHQLGYKTQLGKNVFGQLGYFSASDEARADEFMELVSDDNVQGIFFIRGGWGCARILELIDYPTIAAQRKIIMGFSDITALLNAITYKTGLVTFHGPGGNSTWNAYSVNYVHRLLKDAENVLFKNTSSDAAILTYSSGTVKGTCFGGNLSVLCGMIGSGYLPDWDGKILFLEDVGEEPYRIDRMLTQLKLTGVFDRISGLILGNFRKCIAENPARSFTLEEVFEQHFKDTNFPVFYGAQIGHVRDKFTLPIGIDVQIDADAGTIQLLGTAVR